MNKLASKIVAASIGATVLVSGMATASAATYTVKQGDTLSKIGKAHGVSYQSIMTANNLKSTNIKVGQKLTIGSTTAKTVTTSTTTANTAATATYVVKKGDTLSKIAAAYGTNYKTLMSWNGLSSTNIKVGQKLSVKGKATTTTTAASTTTAQTSNASNVVAIAKQYLGVKYRFGGTSPSTGFDCSGYVSYVFQQAGKMKSRATAAGLYNMSTKVSTPQVGDLVFYSGTYKAGISHVGIYIGNNQMINASGSKVQITNIYSSYWKKYFTGFGRI